MLYRTELAATQVRSSLGARWVQNSQIEEGVRSLSGTESMTWPMSASTGRQRGITGWIPSSGAYEARCGAMPLDIIVAEDGSSAVLPFAVDLAVLAKGKFGHRHGSSRPCQYGGTSRLTLY